MVVIEPVTSADNHPKPSNSTNVGVDSTVGDRLNTDGAYSGSGHKPTAAGYASDGYETASETEVGDGEAVNDNTDKPNDVVEDEHRLKDQTYEDALNDDELKQKILVQMNDAKVEGNKLFGDGLYEEALLKYDYAIQLAPEMPSSSEIRSICHNNRATCFFKLGKYEDTVKECSKALELNPTYMKALVRRGEAHEKLENYDEAIADMKKILELDPSNHQSRRTIFRLEPLAIEKREKMKEEMLGKLKDMGNSILGRFGMSVDNFKAVKDPNTGSYSISFQR
ncbi:putative tetratricopeptide-like helical domain superfamily [Helianthus annuus]|nr:putative tetratricopeptide-like helical domain superfamily [Helianthus annuus]